MHYRFTFIIVLLSFSFSFGQSDKPTNMAFMGLINESNLDQKKAQHIEDYVFTFFKNQHRINLLDRSVMDKILAEQNIQKQDDFLNEAVVKQGQLVGADYLILGTILSSEQSHEYRDVDDLRGGRKLTYRAETVIRYNLSLVKVATSTIEFTQIIQRNGVAEVEKGHNLYVERIPGNAPNRAQLKARNQEKIKTLLNDSFKRAVSRSINVVAGHYFKMFPIEAQLVEIIKEKKDKALQVLVVGNEPLKMGQKLQVYAIEKIEVEGEVLTREEHIGSILVFKPSEDGFAEARVNDCETDLFQIIKNDLSYRITSLKPEKDKKDGPLRNVIRNAINN